MPCNTVATKVASQGAGPLLRAWRRAQGTGQEELAQILGCTQQFIDLVEKGLRPLQPRHHQILADQFDLHIALVDGNAVPVSELHIAVRLIGDRSGRDLADAFLVLDHADKVRVTDFAARLARDRKEADHPKASA